MKSSVNNNILLLEYPTRKEMCLANFRISEFKEGLDGVYGVYSTPDIFIDKYSDEEGNLDYFNVWEGFNYTHEQLWRFGLTFHSCVSNREKLIIDQAHKIDSFGYIIAIVEGDEETKRHEMAHALYAINKDYRYQIDNILEEMSGFTLFKMKKALLAIKYIPEVLQDEIHAYLVAYNQEEFDKIFSDLNQLDKNEIKPLISQLNDLFDKYTIQNHIN